ncbi:hypothetical protein RFI_11450 [Reticulomyxa filosa]|uniref:Uncharacterized protein n=1 Tax=Reticulomyxa filosa TaxID=46433 RepID=X6NK01_RETFI|nr:hypothetical protein RFI_11450 [Reticulomyxa filosa]|eukprot:ETO25687.1 hypothetical protein RFI_11450 [Reticulomyxa filosa]
MSFRIKWICLVIPIHKGNIRWFCRHNDFTSFLSSKQSNLSVSIFKKLKGSSALLEVLERGFFEEKKTTKSGKALPMAVKVEKTQLAYFKYVSFFFLFPFLRIAPIKIFMLFRKNIFVNRKNKQRNVHMTNSIEYKKEKKTEGKMVGPKNGYCKELCFANSNLVSGECSRIGNANHNQTKKLFFGRRKKIIFFFLKKKKKKTKYV